MALLDLVFGRHLTYVLLVVLASASVFTVQVLLTRQRTERTWDRAAWAAFATAALFLTLWVRPGGSSGTCTVNKDVWEPFHTSQGRMNIALFVPIGLFGMRAVRRALPPLLLAALLSCAIETVQAVIPAIGRYCDTSDLIGNVAGAVAGVALGALSLRVKNTQLPPWGPRGRSLWMSTGAALAAMAGLLATTSSVQVVAHAEQSGTASAAQQAAAQQIARQALGKDFHVTRVWAETPLQGDETVMAELEPSSTLSLSWPDRKTTEIEVWGATGTALDRAPDGYPLPGVTGPVHDESAARRAADQYVAAHYPAPATTPARAEGSDDGVEKSWKVIYHYHDDQHPAPAWLTVTLNSAGHLRGVDITAVEPGAGPAGPTKGNAAR